MKNTRIEHFNNYYIKHKYKCVFDKNILDNKLKKNRFSYYYLKMKKPNFKKIILRRKIVFTYGNESKKVEYKFLLLWTNFKFRKLKFLIKNKIRFMDRVVNYNRYVSALRYKLYVLDLFKKYKKEMKKREYFTEYLYLKEHDLRDKQKALKIFFLYHIKYKKRKIKPFFKKNMSEKSLNFYNLYKNSSNFNIKINFKIFLNFFNNLKKKNAKLKSYKKLKKFNFTKNDLFFENLIYLRFYSLLNIVTAGRKKKLNLKRFKQNFKYLKRRYYYNFSKKWYKTFHNFNKKFKYKYYMTIFNKCTNYSEINSVINKQIFLSGKKFLKDAVPEKYKKFKMFIYMFKRAFAFRSAKSMINNFGVLKFINKFENFKFFKYFKILKTILKSFNLRFLNFKQIRLFKNTKIYTSLFLKKFIYFLFNTLKNNLNILDSLTYWNTLISLKRQKINKFKIRKGVKVFWYKRYLKKLDSEKYLEDFDVRIYLNKFLSCFIKNGKKKIN